ncbi:MAG TPA: hypothetical protein VN873_19720 [Candidatus Angelobacter sp.]|nr:hypothetical protein [Candidatus Angelobacter sp.]
MTFFPNGNNAYRVNMDGQQDLGAELTRSEFVTKRQILEKLAKRKEFLECGPMDRNFCVELNPDVIVISDDNSSLFEAQNSRASAWLRGRCGMAADSHNGRERIRVHPCKSSKIVAELKAAGFAVVT